jgi:hypothetical protein
MGKGTAVTRTVAPPRRDSQRVAAGVVRVVGYQELVPGAEAERAQDRVHPGGHVRHEGDVRRLRADEGGERRPRLVEQPLEVAREEADRLPLQALAQALLRFEHGPRAGAEGAVIQEHAVGVEGPVRGERHRRRS